MKKQYKILMSAFCIFTLSHLKAQTPTTVDVLTGSNDSYAEELTTIGDKLYFFYEEPLMGYNDIPAYISASGEVVKLKWPAGFEADGWNVSFKELNGNSYWIQDVYDINIDEYYDCLATMRNDSIVLITNIEQDVYDFEVYGNKLYFSAYSDSTGYELYSYDESVIELVEDIFPGTDNSYPTAFMLHDGKLYFGANNLFFQNTLHEFNGTTITDLNVQGLYNSNYNAYQSFGTDLYYVSDVTYPRNLMHLTTSSTDTIYNQLEGSIENLIMYRIIDVNNEIYIMGYETGVYQDKLYKYNQLTDSIERVCNELDQVYELENYNDTLFIRAHNTITFSNDLYYLIPGVDTAVLAMAGYTAELKSLNGDFYFRHYDGTDEEPWSWNHGAPQMIADVNPFGNSYAWGFEIFQGKLAMSAYDGNHGEEIVFMCSTVAAPTAPTTQIACEGSVVSDLIVNGSNMVYFDADTLGNKISDMVITSSGSVYVENREVVCASDRIEVPFTVSMLPNTAATHLGSGMLKVINPSATYQWVDCATSNPVAGATSQTFQVPGNGSYQCIVTNADGCSATSDCIYVINLSIEENLLNSVSIYPNPSSDILNFSSNELISTIQIASLNGEIISTELVNANSFTMNTNQLTNGLYLVTIFDTNNNLVSKQKVIVNK